MLLIILLETNNKDGSDYLYFKSIISRFYEERGTGISIKPIFMNGKGNYNKIDTKIKNYINQYDGLSQVIYFFDVDSTNIKYDQRKLNNDIIKYCESKKYEIVWYNKTVEDVLIGNVITKNKTKIANDFFLKNYIMQVDERKLNIKEFELMKHQESNVKYILDKYLVKKH